MPADVVNQRTPAYFFTTEAMSIKGTRNRFSRPCEIVRSTCHLPGSLSNLNVISSRWCLLTSSTPAASSINSSQLSVTLSHQCGLKTLKCKHSLSTKILFTEWFCRLKIKSQVTQWVTIIRSKQQNCSHSSACVPESQKTSRYVSQNHL